MKCNGGFFFLHIPLFTSLVPISYQADFDSLEAMNLPLFPGELVLRNVLVFAFYSPPVMVSRTPLNVARV